MSLMAASNHKCRHYPTMEQELSWGKKGKTDFCRKKKIAIKSMRESVQHTQKH